MKIAYTGRKVELAPAQLKKIEARFAKVGRLLDGREQREAHVIVSLERHLHKVEVTVNYHTHQLAGEAADTDLFTAIHAAVERLEKQALKLRAKWRDTRRAPRQEVEEAAPAGEAAAPDSEAEPAGRVFRVSHHRRGKPMTLDEALMEMEKGPAYVVYRDAETGGVSVLLRRPDGHFDLVEA